jgi:hypothetical protein|tara:strand:- start:3692 stop:4387 length:696 start_codon:yes stop_codon:yes gene_type:complete
MGIKPAIVIYTHTDYSDIWPALFSRLAKYMSSYKVNIFVNEKHKQIPQTYNVITYDNNLIYTERLKSCLKELDDDLILFLHEDMILYDEPLHEEIIRLSKLFSSNDLTSIKLIYVTDVDYPSLIDDKLIYNSFSKFSIQPTITTKSYMLELTSKFKLNIWDFELAIQNSGGDFMYKTENEVKRGVYHCDSIIFPYISTAIVKGKWNESEYKNELNSVFTEFNINKTIRGVI